MSASAPPQVDCDELRPTLSVSDLVAAAKRDIGQRCQQLVDHCGNRDPILVRHGERPPNRALSQSDQPVAVILAALKYTDRVRTASDKDRTNA